MFPAIAVSSVPCIRNRKSKQIPSYSTALPPVKISLVNLNLESFYSTVWWVKSLSLKFLTLLQTFKIFKLSIWMRIEAKNFETSWYDVQQASGAFGQTAIFAMKLSDLWFEIYFLCFNHVAILLGFWLQTEIYQTFSKM